MSEFKDYFTNQNFISSYLANKSGNKADSQKGILYVEDDSDLSYWEKFINSVYPNKYEIQAFVKNPQTRGKRELEKYFDSANIKSIFAVDSDYDCLCPNYRFGSKIISNKFIIHSYAHNKESTLIKADNLQIFFNSIKHTIPHNINIEFFLKSFSEICYEGLILFITEINKNDQKNISEEAFHNCFNILNQNIVFENLELNYSVLNLINNNIQTLFSSIKATKEERLSSQKLFTSLRIHQSNAYRFISGHILYDLLSKIHQQLINQLQVLEIERVKENFNGQACGDRISQVKEIFKTSFSLNTFCRNYPINDNDEIHQHILNRIHKMS